MIFIRIAILILFFACPANVWAGNNESAGDEIYSEIEKLTAFGYAPPTIIGHRPYPLTQLALLVGAAVKKFDETQDICDKEEDLRSVSICISRRRVVSEILKNLTREFHEELIENGRIAGERHNVYGHPFELFKVELAYLNGPNVTIRGDNGIGGISALENPLRDRNYGRYAVDGAQTSFETSHSVNFYRYFSAYLKPRFEVNIPRQGADMRPSAHIQNLYGVLEAGNFSFEAGRDSLVWGVGEHGGLMMSDNPRPLDLIKITNPHPASLPWIFKYLGKWKYTIFGANLGPEANKKYGWLAGWKFSLMPADFVELGFGHVVKMGGEGAPSLSVVDVLGEFAGFRPAGSSLSAVNKSNHMMEAEFLLRLKALRGLNIYGTLTNEDKRDTIKRFFKDGSGYLAGVYIPLVSDNTAFRAEYAHTPSIMYRHGTFLDGWTLNKKNIGSDLGPDADRISFVVSRRAGPNMDFKLETAWDHRRSDIKTTEIESDGTLGDVITVTPMPAENRYRVLLGGIFKIKRNIDVTTSFGFERAVNFGFSEGIDRSNFLAAVSLAFDFDRYFAFAAN